MASLEVPGIDVSSRVRARDINLGAVADLRRRVLMITAAIDTVDHDVSVTINLPAPGRWQFIKSETNLTDQTWLAMQVTTDADSVVVADEDTMILSGQFTKTFMTPDQRRLTFYDGEVRPGEAVLEVFGIETTKQRPAYTYARYCPVSTEAPAQLRQALDDVIANGIPQRPVIELIMPVTVIG